VMGGTIEFLVKYGYIAEGILGTFPIFKIRVRSIPFHNLSRIVAQGTGTEEEPPKFAVETS
jgi:hypothetical protein